jgi:poly-gamma-glutamate biosynthesis protein PgsC/CapC
VVTIFVVGVIVALIIDEVTGITPGGIIVPGFLALAWGEPWRIGATLGAALLTVGVVTILQRFIFVYGRRRFAYSVLTGIVLKQLLLMLLPRIYLLSYGLLILGFVIPGLLAENCLRQGIVRTFAATIFAAAITRLVAGALLGWMP